MKRLLPLTLIFAALMFVGCSKKTQENQEPDAQGQVSEHNEAASETSVNAEEEIPPEKGTYAYIKTIKSKKEYKEAVRDLTQDYLMGRWSVEVISEDLNYVYFIFDDDGTYYVFSPYGGYMGQNGKYKLDGNSLTLFFPSSEESRWDELIFPGKKETTLVYDYDFMDFYEVGVLRNEHLILRKGVEARPAGTKCILKGMEVMKTERTPVLAKDNLKLRHQPSLKGREGSFWYGAYLNAELKELLEKKFHKVNNAYDEKMLLNVMLKGMVTSYDAKTVSEDTIDGITAPWYRIRLFDYDEESMPQDYWVFGGYLEPFEESRKEECKEILFNSALEKKLIILDEEEYDNYMRENNRENLKKIAGDSTVKIADAGGEAVDDEILKGTIFKIGMTKSEVLNLLGVPDLKEDDYLEYYISFGNYGYDLELYFKGDKLVQIKTVYEK